MYSVSKMQMHSWPSGNWSTFQKPHIQQTVFAAGQLHLPFMMRDFFPISCISTSIWDGRGHCGFLPKQQQEKFTNWTNAHIWDQLKGYLFSAKWLLLKYLVTLYAILIWPFQLSSENKNWIYYFRPAVIMRYIFRFGLIFLR